MKIATFVVLTIVSAGSFSETIDSTTMVQIPEGMYKPFFSSPPASVKNTSKVAISQSTTFPTTRSVTIKSFWMDKYPVTRKQFMKFTETSPEWKKDKVSKLFSDQQYLSTNEIDQAPITNVSWFAAQSYCESAGKTLPTTDQYEYVYTNNNLDQTNIKSIEINWLSKPATKALRKVGEGNPNSFGIFDLYDLIFEWTYDFNAIIVNGGDSRDISDTDGQLFCGSGSLNSLDATNYPAFLRFSLRSSLDAKFSTSQLGFRCVINQKSL
ncbi:MAG: formylglycine-generating enzyme family protein [Methylacidiphilales bacterium]|nr:formylglycine-generating enzyme family protein [Candidatus Methylacidiphilales bacterium]